MKKKEIIQKLKNWSEEAINVAEMTANDISVDREGLLKDLEKIVIMAKYERMSLDEVKDLIWGDDSIADKVYNDQSLTVNTQFDFNNLPIAGNVVSDLIVKNEVPGQGAISSSLGNWEVLSEIREVSMEYFSYTPPYSVSEYKRVEKLRDEIKSNNYIYPLIVVWDSEGLYILEGAHRFDALNMLEKKSFPALIVKDLDN